jgi:hypothetical protein
MQVVQVRTVSHTTWCRNKFNTVCNFTVICAHFNTMYIWEYTKKICHFWINIVKDNENWILVFKNSAKRSTWHLDAMGSLVDFHDAFSWTRLYSVDDRVISEWWWTDEDKYPCLKRDSNPWSQRPSDKGLRLRPRTTVTSDGSNGKTILGPREETIWTTPK